MTRKSLIASNDMDYGEMSETLDFMPGAQAGPQTRLGDCSELGQTGTHTRLLALAKFDSELGLELTKQAGVRGGVERTSAHLRVSSFQEARETQREKTQFPTCIDAGRMSMSITRNNGMMRKTKRQESGIQMALVIARMKAS